HSRRAYKNKPLDSDVLGIISQMVDAVNEEAGLDLILIEDATPYFQIFSGKFSMIVVAGKDSQKTREDCGYYGESIVLQCVYHGLSTCWVSGSYNENKVYEDLDLPSEKRIYAVIAIGYAKEKYTLIEKAMYKATHKKSKSYQDMFEYCDDKLPEAYAYGMQLVEKAPSAVNRRPVNFRYENGKLSGSVDEPYSDKSVDFGIAKLHFVIGAMAKGVYGKWGLDNVFEESRRIKFAKLNEN
ncbi:MAG TPA: hypothetical protein DCZ02_05450, partial [Ruminococcaceae bacterium]|nr:hypothetical protein [Oscillospiraceae bacterium]